MLSTIYFYLALQTPDEGFLIMIHLSCYINSQRITYPFTASKQFPVYLLTVFHS